jgi:exopolyphosphatase/guanosine-5'-triphosphate,3'-diphosphate pyrophosphatase
MIFAAIDIGSNAARLLFANVFESEKKIYVEKATLVRIPTRLGKDVYTNNKISKKRADKLIKTLKAFKLLIDVYKPVDFAACATAAMREAVNGEELINRIKDEAGLDVRLVTGIEEADIIRQTNKIEFKHPDGLSMYIDVGGGSTEISVLLNDVVLGVTSFKIGTLRILSEKVKKSEWKRLENFLMEYKEHFGSINVVGSGGNINKINKIYGTPSTYTLKTSELMYALNHLESFSLEERIQKLGLRPDRADVIVPAAKIFLFIIKIIKAKSLFVPKIGFADGLIYQLYENRKKINT